MISTDIQVHPCQPDGSVSRTLVKPAGAKTAAVYGGSHDERPVTIEQISLRAMVSPVPSTAGSYFRQKRLVSIEKDALQLMPPVQRDC
jgi:hypothetical protein